MWPFNIKKRKAQRERFEKVKAQFEAHGITIESRRAGIWRWLKEKWDRFGSI